MTVRLVLVCPPPPRPSIHLCSSSTVVIPLPAVASPSQVKVNSAHGSERSKMEGHEGERCKSTSTLLLFDMTAAWSSTTNA
ncbi:hypothetical protein CORC01_11858 [Colletotrichum orchidophilum]|uniref:Uncharacterized protein n=1 Tax=Colletotrichum orchidophilum TaxID=1209926 RepID=A0A1G4AUW8_9PEZI|nr:uncharacterized protein CORC01_11858 [Colletotrichum orchidophilum]OHE92852.1 hypothetical protein CORC01_11858 [Colletotrichum orchidophilum]